MAKVIVQLLARDAGFHHAVEIFRVDGDDALHLRCVDANAAERRVHMAFERSARSKSDHGHAMGRASLHDLRDSSVVCGKTTASGGSFAVHVSVCACCWRTVSFALKRWPKRSSSSARAAVSSRDFGAGGGAGARFHQPTRRDRAEDRNSSAFMLQFVSLRSRRRRETPALPASSRDRTAGCGAEIGQTVR